jgi:hypothetical protein
MTGAPTPDNGLNWPYRDPGRLLPHALTSPAPPLTTSCAARTPCANCRPSLTPDPATSGAGNAFSYLTSHRQTTVVVLDVMLEPGPAILPAKAICPLGHFGASGAAAARAVPGWRS